MSFYESPDLCFLLKKKSKLGSIELTLAQKSVGPGQWLFLAVYPS